MNVKFWDIRTGHKDGHVRTQSSVEELSETLGAHVMESRNLVQSALYFKQGKENGELRNKHSGIKCVVWDSLRGDSNHLVILDCIFPFHKIKTKNWLDNIHLLVRSFPTLLPHTADQRMLTLGAVSTGPPLWLGQWEGLARVSRLER